MSDEILDKLNEIYAQVKDRVEGSIHNTLWQIMINDSLNGAEAAFNNTPGHPCVDIALGDGGYIHANFDGKIDENLDEIIDLLNQKVFGLLPEAAFRVVCKSMRR